MASLRDQEEECDRLAGAFYTKGLMTEPVSDIFDKIYGQSYSKASISRKSMCVLAVYRKSKPVFPLLTSHITLHT